ncbi:MAG TPA: aldehyde dehydrogenase family protein, partial [Burkholderiaceae bacterium]|nr:aldehyde dehydrogenase family protein [Burkholderiaceae bacterium]
MKLPTQMLIDGDFVAGAGEAEKVLNPSTGELLVSLPEASVDQVNQAVAGARRAFESWSETTAAERARMLLKLADAIESRAEEFARLESLNCGKPYARALGDEIPAIADCYRFFAGAARCMTGPLAGEYLAGHTSMVRRDPVGVVGSIAPWNYPLMMAAWKTAPALAAGNTVVIKPSEQTPLTALLLAQVAAEILPKGVLNVITGRGASVGQPLVEHPKVAMVSLTGDVGTGRKILQAASATLKRTHLELGGKAPVIVFDDADVAAVVEGLKVFGYYNAGQDCTAACRVYAGAKVHDKLVADLTSAVSGIKMGLQDEPDVEIGPLISERQRSRVASFV